MKLPPAGADAVRAIEEHDRIAALRSVVAAAVFVAAGELVYWSLDRSVLPGVAGLRTMRLGHVALAAATAAIVLARGGRPRWFSTAGFVLLVLPFVPVIWLTERRMVAAEAPWAPFVGTKLVALGVALVSPAPFGVGAALIGLLLVEAGISWIALDLGARSSVIAVGEPWVTVLVCLLALGFLAVRARTQRRDRELARARARAESLEELTRLFVAIRDRTNTPLQTLEISTALLRRKVPEAATIADRMEAALVRLREFSSLLSDYEDSLRLRGGPERRELEALLAQLEREMLALRRRPATP